MKVLSLWLQQRCWCQLFCFLSSLDNFDRIICENDLRRALGTAADLLQVQGKTGRVIYRHATPGGVRGKMGETCGNLYLLISFCFMRVWLCPGKVFEGNLHGINFGNPIEWWLYSLLMLVDRVKLRKISILIPIQYLLFQWVNTVAWKKMTWQPNV